MTPGIAAFFAILAVLTGSYAALAPTRKITLNADDEYLIDTETPGLFNKWVRPAIQNFLPVAPSFLIAHARGSGPVASLLIRSGNPWRLRPEEYVVLRVISAAALAAVGSVLSVLAVIPVSPLIGFLGGIAMGWFLPAALLGSAWSTRKKAMIRTLPEALDLLRICFNAGLTFTNALAQVIVLLPDGPARTELTRVQADLNAGRTVNQAMEDFAVRMPTEQVESFVRAVAISQDMGTDMAATLASQADEARLQYERNVDVKAQKLQTNLFIPIILLFLPALLILIFGPSITSLAGLG